MLGGSKGDSIWYKSLALGAIPAHLQHALGPPLDLPSHPTSHPSTPHSAYPTKIPAMAEILFATTAHEVLSTICSSGLESMHTSGLVFTTL